MYERISPDETEGPSYERQLRPSNNNHQQLQCCRRRNLLEGADYLEIAGEQDILADQSRRRLCCHCEPGGGGGGGSIHRHHLSAERAWVNRALVLCIPLIQHSRRVPYRDR